MPTETITRSSAILPVEIRTARKRHLCSDCEKPIEPGDRYEHSSSPPHRIDVYDVDHWVTWRTHYPRHDVGGSPPHARFLPGCAEAAAYREKAVRESGRTCTVVAVVGDTTYPCHSHEGGKHHFAADRPDPCHAPFCRLDAGHRTLHDIPSGHAEVVDLSA